MLPFVLFTLSDVHLVIIRCSNNNNAVGHEKETSLRRGLIGKIREYKLFFISSLPYLPLPLLLIRLRLCSPFCLFCLLSFFLSPFISASLFVSLGLSVSLFISL